MFPQTLQAITQGISNAGYRPPHATVRFGVQTIRQVQRRLGSRAPHSRGRSRDGLLPEEGWKASLTRLLDIPRESLPLYPS